MSLLLAVLMMGHERKSRGLDSHCRTQPSIVSLPLRCSKQQPSSALTVKFDNLQLERNSNALLRQNEKNTYQNDAKDEIYGGNLQGFFTCC